jgi:hypothetical protein
MRTGPARVHDEPRRIRKGRSGSWSSSGSGSGSWSGSGSDDEGRGRRGSWTGTGGGDTLETLEMTSALPSTRKKSRTTTTDSRKRSSGAGDSKAAPGGGRGSDSSPSRFVAVRGSDPRGRGSDVVPWVQTLDTEKLEDSQAVLF